MIDCPDPGWGSVLGNTLERGVGYTPHGDHAAQQCGMEVVLASGEVLRTGMGAMADNPAWPLYKGAFGPSLDGLFFQSNLGIVTKIGVWLMPEPEAISVVEAGFRREEDIVPLVDILRRLRLDGTVPTATIANWMRIAAGNSTRAEWYDGKGAMPPSAIETLIRKMGIGHWNLRFGLYGAPAIVEENFKRVVKAFSSVEGAEITRADYARGQEILPHHRTLAGIPSVDFMSLNWLGGAGAHIECPPVVPMRGADVLAHYRRRTALFNAHGFDHYCGLTSTTPRAFINTASIIFDSEDAGQAEQARALGAALIEDASQNRLGGYRAHIAEMDLVAAQFAFGEHAGLRSLRAAQGFARPGRHPVAGQAGRLAQAFARGKGPGAWRAMTRPSPLPMTRREIVVLGGAACLANLAPLRAAAHMTGGARVPMLAVADARYAASEMFAARLVRHGATRFSLASDAGGLWFAALEPRLGARAACVAGLTLESDLFILRRLATASGASILYLGWHDFRGDRVPHRLRGGAELEFPGERLCRKRWAVAHAPGRRARRGAARLAAVSLAGAADRGRRQAGQRPAQFSRVLGDQKRRAARIGGSRSSQPALFRFGAALSQRQPLMRAVPERPSSRTQCTELPSRVSLKQ